MGIELNKIKDLSLRDRIRSILGDAPPGSRIGPDGATVFCPPPRCGAPSEKDLHDAIIDYCKDCGWYYIHSRMDRRTTNAVGTPDFFVFKPGGRVICIECKRPGGKPTVSQQATILHLRRLGHTAAIVDNWADALALLCTA